MGGDAVPGDRCSEQRGEWDDGRAGGLFFNCRAELMNRSFGWKDSAMAGRGLVGIYVCYRSSR